MARKRRYHRSTLCTWSPGSLCSMSYPGLGKSVKYLSLYAQDGYETALYLNSSMQLSDVSQALTVVGRKIYCKVSVK